MLTSFVSSNPLWEGPSSSGTDKACQATVKYLKWGWGGGPVVLASFAHSHSYEEGDPQCLD